MKALTILIPVYNTEKYIKRCLDSLIVSEIMDDIEILVVNDGGKDHSVEIIQKYVDSYPETVRLIDKENGGHGSTINAGIKEAKGKYFRENKTNKHIRNAKFGWYRYDSRFAIPVYRDDEEVERYNIFHASLIVRYSEDGKLYLYDVIDIKKRNEQPD